MGIEKKRSLMIFVRTGMKKILLYGNEDKNPISIRILR
jgi:hypothetical protein